MSHPNDNARVGLGARTLNGLLWGFTGNGVQFAVQFLTLIVLARLVSPAEFGVVAIAMVVVNLSEVFSQIGTGAAIVQRAELDDLHVRAGYAMAGTLGILFCGIVILNAHMIGRWFDMPDLPGVLRALACVFVINSLRIVAEALLQRQLAFKVIAASNVLSYTIGFACIAVLLAYAGYGVWALVAGHVTQALVKTVFLNLAHPHSRRLTLSLKHYRELLHFGGGFALARLGNFTAVQGDNVVVGRFLGTDAVGLYGRAYQLMILPIKLFGSVLDAVLFPAMASVQNDVATLARIYQQGVALVAIMTLPLSIFLFIYAREIILGVLGPQWDAAIAPFRVLAVAMLFRSSSRMSDSLAKAMGLVYRRAWRQWIYAALVVFGAAVGSRFDLVGVASGVAMATLANSILMTSLSLNALRLSWSRFLFIHWPALVLGLVTAVVSWGTAATLSLVRFPDLVKACAGALIVCAVTGLLMAIFPSVFLGEYGRDTVARFAGRLGIRGRVFSTS